MITQYDVQSIISGVGKGAASDLIQAAAAQCNRGQKASGDATYKEQQKEQENPFLTTWISSKNLWVKQIDESRYLTRGAEQRVYLDADPAFVLKLNDAVFYASWLDYFHSLMLHNLFFPGTAYELLGFHTENDILYALVRQPFVVATAITDLDAVHTFLTGNGFRNIRNHDFINDELGLLLEDMHDENVLTSDGVLFFVDTVFYLLPGFYRKELSGPL